MNIDSIIGFARWENYQLDFKDWRDLGNPNFVGFPVEFKSDMLLTLLDYDVLEVTPYDHYQIWKDGKLRKINTSIFDAFRMVHDLADSDLAEEEVNLNNILNEIQELANDGILWDGGHHKLWFLKQIRDLIPEFEDSEAIAP